MLEPLISRPARADCRGRPRAVDLREVVNAVVYVLHEGCRWRSLPHDFPAWQTVYWYFATWTDDGTPSASKVRSVGACAKPPVAIPIPPP